MIYIAKPPREFVREGIVVDMDSASFIDKDSIKVSIKEIVEKTFDFVIILLNRIKVNMKRDYELKFIHYMLSLDCYYELMHAFRKLKFILYHKVRNLFFRPKTVYVTFIDDDIYISNEIGGENEKDKTRRDGIWFR